jgi:plastocyanin
MKKTVFLWALPLVLLGLALPAYADGKPKKGGALSGKLKVTAPARKVISSGHADDMHEMHEMDSDYGSYSAPAVAGHNLPEEVVIYLKKVPGDFKAPKKHAQLDQNDHHFTRRVHQFTRRVLAVLKGTVVDFTNHDKIYHNIFSNSQVNKFDLGRKKTGETVSRKMLHSEVPVKVYCDIHSNMRAYILVLGNPYFTTVGPDQKFEITGIPPGTYTMVAWHDYWEPVEKKVTIKKGKTTSVDVLLDKVRN